MSGPLNYPLEIVSDTKTPTGSRVIVWPPMPGAVCRTGPWLGTEQFFTETVTLAYEHGKQANVYVGWLINGDSVIVPGVGKSVPFPGLPCPGLPSVTYICPVGQFFHEISLTSTSGDPQETLTIQVQYAIWNGEASPTYLGPRMQVSLAGSETEWPGLLVANYNECILNEWLKLRQRLLDLPEFNVTAPPDGPPRGLSEEGLIRLKSAVDSMENVDREKQPALAEALKGDIASLLRSQLPGVSRLPMMGHRPG